MNENILNLQIIKLGNAENSFQDKNLKKPKDKNKKRKISEFN